VRLSRRDVLLADAGGGVAGGPEQRGGGGDPWVGAEAVDAVAVAVLAVGVAVVAGQDRRAAGGAARRGAERPVEHRPLPGGRIDVRRPDDRVAITAGDRAPVVGDDEQDAASAWW